LDSRFLVHGGPFEQKWKAIFANVSDCIGSLLSLLSRRFGTARDGKPLGQAAAFVVGLTVMAEKCDEADERGSRKEADRNLHARPHALILARVRC
jgi:hypothetical protein